MSSSRFTPRAAFSAAAVSLLLLTSCGGQADDEEADAEQPEAASSTEQAQSDQGEGAASAGDGQPFAEAQLSDAVGNPLGTVRFIEQEAGVLVEAEVQNLSPGIRGISVHENGVCEPDSTSEWGIVGDFYSAGGHLPAEDAEESEMLEDEELLEDDDFSTIEGEVPQDEVEDGLHHPDHAGDLPNMLINEDGSGFLSVLTDRLSSELLVDTEEGTSVILHSEPDNHASIPSRYAPEGADLETRMTGDTGTRVGCAVVESAE